MSGGRRAAIVTALVATAAWLAPIGAAALTVRLLGADGRPLAGARVRLLDVPGTAVADARGEATLLPDPPPPFTLLVTRSDGVALRPVEVAALPGAGVLELHLEASFTEAVTVLSTSAPDLEVPPAGAFTLLGGGDLGERNPPTLAAALEAVPGTGANGNGLAAVPALRGLASGRTLILLDEGRVASERRAGPSATFLDPATVEEIEVLRGPGSVAYGSDAFGGVIRARTRIPSPGDEPAARWAFTAGEGTGERAGAAEVGARLAGGGLLLGANVRRFDDYESPRGRVRDSGGTLAGLRVGWQRAVAGGNLRLLWRGDRARDVGKPVGEASDTRTAYPEEDSDRFSASFERPGPGSWSRLATSLFWGRSSLVTERDRAAGAAGPREIARSEVAADDWGARVEAERPLGPGRLVVGADLSGRTGLRAVNRTLTYGDCCTANEVVEVSVADAHRDDVGTFVAVDRLVAGVLVSAGLRADRVRAENRAGWFGDRASAHTAGSGFVAASASLGRGFDASLQVARGFRDALLSDRFYRGVTGRGFITGNPDLAPERSRQLDAALRWRGGEASLAAYAYLYRIDDLIERYKAGADYFFRNRGEAELRGVEVEAGLPVGRGVTLELGLAAARGAVVGAGSPLDGIPPRALHLTLRADEVRWGWWYARAAAVARDERPGPTERTAPGYAALEGGAGVALGGGLEAALVVKNLLDQAFLASADADTPLAPGRSVSLTLRGTL